MEPCNPQHVSALMALANGIIPADSTDSGAQSVNAGQRLAERVATGINAAIYVTGIEAARSLAMRRYGRELTLLSPKKMDELIGLLRDWQPAFFKQLRADVAALYLSDPGVWERIGFPGPSIDKGGYPDFDQPQK